MTRQRPIDVLFVTSSGGHLTEVLDWLPSFADVSWRIVLNAEGPLPDEVRPRVLRITHAERDWKVLWNFVEAWRLLRRWRPLLIVSPGAGCAVPFAILGRLLAIPYVHVELMAAVRRPTLTGRLVRPFARKIIVQWPSLLAAFPRAECHQAFPASLS